MDVPFDRFTVLFQQGFKFDGVRLLSCEINPDSRIQMIRRIQKVQRDIVFLRLLKIKFPPEILIIQFQSAKRD